MARQPAEAAVRQNSVPKLPKPHLKLSTFSDCSRDYSVVLVAHIMEGNIHLSYPDELGQIFTSKSSLS